MAKKLTALLLALCMIFTLAACSGGSSSDETWESELGTAGKLRVGMAADYPPYESYDAQGNVVGLDADIAAMIAEELGVELEIVPMEFDTIISAVTANGSSILSAFFVIFSRLLLLLLFLLFK